ncbi:hypothetical protein IQ244_29290 [Nostoc sp. LEGE 06077]|uniref:hypothetical protein n=1 Tax=Nostoc sp. LEGE 06077 TaxID=915325 RepID=UPI0018808B21|nr:hypothetical protein [Nostoc sp. LEGE 06077]MBE9210525.1 hypothetical protein [Nostoc sp. LEGE 06077]
MSNINSNFSQFFQHQTNQDDDNLTLSANRLIPTNDQIKDWLQSPQIKQWLTKVPMGITNNLKMEAINTIISRVSENPNKDCRVQFGSTAIGVDVLRWQLWAFYQLPYANGIKAPDCPYTLEKHLAKDTRTSEL